MHYISYFFRPLNRDQQNPWSVSGRPFYSARLIGLALLLFGLFYPLSAVYQDYSFLSGSAYTTGTFVKITGSKVVTDSRYGTRTDYSGQYRYAVSGRIYLIEQTDEVAPSFPVQFHPTILIAYKTANPTDSIIVYGSSLQNNAKGSLVDGLAVGLAGYTLIYLIAVPIEVIQNRKRQSVSDSQDLSTAQRDSDPHVEVD